MLLLVLRAIAHACPKKSWQGSAADASTTMPAFQAMQTSLEQWAMAYAQAVVSLDLSCTNSGNAWTMGPLPMFSVPCVDARSSFLPPAVTMAAPDAAV